jgi:hypothetical protein
MDPNHVVNLSLDKGGVRLGFGFKKLMVQDLLFEPYIGTRDWIHQLEGVVP